MPEAAHVRDFCTSIIPDAIPIQVDCRPLLDKPLKECFTIVPDHIATNGGSQLIGWAIWEWPGVLIEAEFHTVWKTPDNEIVCLTPNRLMSRNIVFLPDPNKKYAGRQIDNIRKQLVKDWDVTRMIYIYRRFFEILNKGDLANQHGEITISVKSFREKRTLEKEVANLQRRLEKRYG